ncbi:MAG: DEAD/SNF2-like helicase [Edafosvirus sp.]|uniref:DEAD/SNF2-like helicase n=1 Tax=Edafosvirus sp. TaxID=2487765 RepID=A0A3G4ZVC2_9VIRU|nr:MAG: DEAD/SNF2-like helicase [Edafosvirus sp.]
MSDQSKRRQNYDELLQKIFGYKSLKDKQFEIIDAIINDKRNVCTILPTGYGKSLCYQLPAIYTKKVVIVISPLISLMEDQKANLEKVGIKACCYNSTISKKERYEEKQKILDGDYMIVYLTPEFIVNSEDLLTNINENIGITLFAVDEAHSVSCWGESFRPTYKELSCIKEWFPEIPLLALTGTATPRVEKDIIESLNLVDPLCVKTSFDRPNLYITIKPKVHVVEDLLPHFYGEKKKENCIVYCQTRKETEKIATMLKGKNIKCDAYHAGISNDERYRIHHDFIDGNINCIIATISFGMGIDKPDIRQVIHYGCPKDMESYYQEIGRAGRDGNPSECYIYFSRSDFITNKYFIEDIKNEKYKKYRTDMVKEIEKYLYSTLCRRKLILEYFGEIYDAKNDKCCDNCTSGKLKTATSFNFGQYAVILLNMMYKFKLSYGMTMLINIIRGSKSKKIPSFIMKSDLFGKGKNKSAEWWKLFIQILINENYLDEKKGSNKMKYCSYIVPNNKAMTWLSKNKDIDEPILELLIPSHMDKVIGVKTKKPKLINISNDDNDNNDNDDDNLDQNHKRWDEDEEKQLLKQIKSESISDIATDHKRTDGAIRSRLRHIAYQLHVKGKTVPEIMEITRLSKEKVTELIQKKTKIDDNKQENKTSPKEKEKNTYLDELEKEFNEFLTKNKKNKKIHIVD